ncbi:unnamed protein product [Paramecium primaurelia]|uniref:VWFA domain-containing protein n=1 Tax=Paramecium primaurelia TaxID=5886 RepID=A0A8S1NKS7_PARPR|nr:unnamed protein product [Paramecium primaurelia]
MTTPYIYWLKESAVVQEYSVVGIIDGSGSMCEAWNDLCKAWNYFVTGFKSVYCIQYDDTAILQESPQLTTQKGEGTNIELGFKELIKLIKSGNLLQNILIVFVTDGIGEHDGINEYFQEMSKEFEQLHSQGYQFKFHTLALGNDFSHSVAAELKMIIHNSGILSSQIDLIQNTKIDFTKVLQDIKDEIFYQMIRVDPQCQLTTFTGPVHRVTPNQVLFTTSNSIRVGGKQINLDKEGITPEALDRFIRQIMSKLMEFNSAGKDVKQESIQALQIIEKLKSRVTFKDEDDDIKKFIDQNIQKIEEFASGNLNLNQFEPLKAAQFMHDVQDLIIRDKKKMQRIKRKSAVHAQLTMHPQQPKQQVKDYYKELALKRLEQYEKQLNNQELFEDLKEFAKQNKVKTLDQIVYLTKTHDFQLKNIKEFIQTDEDTAIDMIDLFLISLD